MMYNNFSPGNVLGVLNTYEPLSLDMLKNVVASLNSAGLLLQLEMYECVLLPLSIKCLF